MNAEPSTDCDAQHRPRSNRNRCFPVQPEEFAHGLDAIRCSRRVVHDIALPDVDVVGSRFGIRYEDTWGHRGVTHSFAFAVVMATVVYLFGRLARFRALKMALTAFVVLATHAVLDAFTDGGYGCALLWPFSNERIFAPWTPIPVAPMGRAFFSMEGLTVAALELLFSLPVLAYAFWPAGNRRTSR